jgi:hypothetical protein
MIIIIIKVVSVSIIQLINTLHYIYIYIYIVVEILTQNFVLIHPKEEISNH